MSTHTASRTIIATPRAVFRALIDPESMTCWRAPTGMTLRVLAFDPRPGGRYRMELHYDHAGAAPGKPTPSSDMTGTFIELVAEDRIVEDVDFESADSAFAGTMRLTTSMTPVTGGTKVTIVADNVPPGIDEDDHREGMNATLKQLANFLE